MSWFRQPFARSALTILVSSAVSAPRLLRMMPPPLAALWRIASHLLNYSSRLGGTRLPRRRGDAAGGMKAMASYRDGRPLKRRSPETEDLSRQALRSVPHATPRSRWPSILRSA
jgi:hypothetical protein